MHVFEARYLNVTLLDYAASLTLLMYVAMWSHLTTPMEVTWSPDHTHFDSHERGDSSLQRTGSLPCACWNTAGKRNGYTTVHETRADKAGPRTHTKDEQYETNIATAFQQSFFTCFWLDTDTLLIKLKAVTIWSGHFELHVHKASTAVGIAARYLVFSGQR